MKHVKKMLKTYLHVERGLRVHTPTWTCRQLLTPPT